MKFKTNIKAGSRLWRHNQTIVPDSSKVRGVKVKTNLKTSGLRLNHSLTLVRDNR